MHLWVFWLHQVIYVLKNSNNINSFANWQICVFLKVLGASMDANIFNDEMFFLLDNNLEFQGTLIID